MRAGRRVHRQERLFPGYLFIQLSEQDSGWHTIHSIRGVTKLVAFGDRPAAVPPSVIDALKLQTQASANDDRPALRPSDRLPIAHRPFTDMEAIFHRFDGQERIIVVMNMPNKPRRLTRTEKEISKM